jgi:hypothetical protein
MLKQITFLMYKPFFHPPHANIPLILSTHVLPLNSAILYWQQICVKLAPNILKIITVIHFTEISKLCV